MALCKCHELRIHIYQDDQLLIISGKHYPNSNPNN